MLRRIGEKKCKLELREQPKRHTQNRRELLQSLGRRRGCFRGRKDGFAVIIQGLNLGALGPHTQVSA